MSAFNFDFSSAFKDRSFREAGKKAEEASSMASFEDENEKNQQISNIVEDLEVAKSQRSSFVDDSYDQAIERKVKAIIVDKLGVEPDEVIPSASFVNDLGADSLDAVELIMEFEKEFGISIPDEEAENLSTVGSVLDYLEEQDLR